MYDYIIISFGEFAAMIGKKRLFYIKTGIFLLCFFLCGCEENETTKKSATGNVSETIAAENAGSALSDNPVHITDKATTAATVTISEPAEAGSTCVTADSLQRVTEDSPEAIQIAEIQKRNPYLTNCSFWNDVLQYWERTREVTDISMYFNPLYQTDSAYYSAEQFQNEPSLIIHLAKNEIYARHGYIFKDSDLENYFLGQCWYLPEVPADEFDPGVLNDFEKANLKLLALLDRQS